MNVICRKATLAGALLLIGGGAQAAVIDFETPGQYADNFRTLYSGLTVGQSDNGVDNDYVRIGRPMIGTTTRASLLYDTTASDGDVTRSTFSLSPGGPAVTVTADVWFTAGGASWGVYFINASDRQQAVLALFNVNASGGNDNIRFTLPTATQYVNPASTASTEPTLSLTTNSYADAGITVNEFKTISASYWLNEEGKIVMSMTAGTRTLESAPITGLDAFSQVEIALRISPAGADADYILFDNIDVSMVPEPTVLGLIGAAGLLMGRRRHA